MSNKSYYKPNLGKRKREVLAVVLLGLIALLLATAALAAYYSDYVSNSGEIGTSTLKINGTYTSYHNEVAKPLDEINDLNPGDIILIMGTITNVGNQSAWVREKIEFFADDPNFLDGIRIFEGAFTQDDFWGEPSGYQPYELVFSTGGMGVTSNRVLDGSGENAQIESGSNYDYIGSSQYSFAITIYFLPSASNTTQGKTLKISLTTQALQFKNNNAAQPSEEAWSTVEAI